jgi:hypothetical protein
LAYYNFNQNKEISSYQPGYSQISVKNIKYFTDDDPFKLVYSSSSFDDGNAGKMSGVFVYELNKNYSPPN